MNEALINLVLPFIQTRAMLDTILGEISAKDCHWTRSAVYPYNVELNPFLVPSQSTFNDTSDLITRIKEACNYVSSNHLRAFV
ncbi:hypothetical protein PHYBLDRAFT_148512 [Phycomyces blakesleeanus NRRL 1555(-)]|uniref:Uncharacterized protein n=1 Tax=Phycomyces blakesleeanus (strain ATCC 8743b / DSM 1359 / FGSC 10004 / NBRC 33097 / NRRL 1555) TaxID=763407 RepID=A0A163A2D9_PHYB8|nr:hypothetical protein PHYBLDRAFT_148512 [Phycomyces blakesleeanus NRRL 1555(-)]OAD70591.1 hypothetical protein PHYBLDRAFT_148512 [Phycomyces blakesleeanus NRRL 1555(-)]|eukprot:XP_018288631.1 hypothetical protein PHYBLDRAFT_148512 [Phycomyces blakesleeanus NRRL 1555(-)]